jgi:hypothetical protein
MCSPFISFQQNLSSLPNRMICSCQHDLVWSRGVCFRESRVQVISWIWREDYGTIYAIGNTYEWFIKLDYVWKISTSNVWFYRLKHVFVYVYSLLSTVQFTGMSTACNLKHFTNSANPNVKCTGILCVFCVEKTLVNRMNYLWSSEERDEEVVPFYVNCRVTVLQDTNLLIKPDMHASLSPNADFSSTTL